ncbi:MAG: hypothetical protein WCF23_00585 [Candidatus Nitrosopolaris sp.]
MDKIKRVAADQLPLIIILSVLFVPLGWDEIRALWMRLTSTERTGWC